MDKLHSYQGFSGRLHEWRDDLKAKFSSWREDREGDNLTKQLGQGGKGSAEEADYSHIYRSGEARRHHCRDYKKRKMETYEIINNIAQCDANAY